MSEASVYQGWRNKVKGRKITQVAGVQNPNGVECVTLAWDYAHILFPKVPIEKSVTTGNAKTIFANASSEYFTKITNNHADASQLPHQGDLMIFGPTPSKGYTNLFENPDGHVGICDGATAKGYGLLQQNAPAAGEGVNVTEYPWNFRPCIGWLRPKAA